MIPICHAPKRFVAALNRERAPLGRLFRQLHKFAPAAQAVAIPFPVNRRVSGCRFFSTAPIPMSGWVASSPHNPVMQEQSVYADSMNLLGPRDAAWFTGKQPAQCAGAVDGKIHSLPQLTLDGLTRERLHAYFDNTWALTEVLLGSLQGEEAFMRPPYHDLRHPMIFYLGHPAVFYINKLRVAGLLKEGLDAYLESIFEVGVDEMSWDDLSKNKMPWPSVQKVNEYRRKAYTTISGVINSVSEDAIRSISQDSPLWCLVMAFEHERIHIETSSVLINELPRSLVRFPEALPPYHPTVVAKASSRVHHPQVGKDFPKNEMVHVPAQTVTIGKPRDFPSFGWDNEYGLRSVDVPEFHASKFKISNGEFLAFVRDGGYARRELWTELGWQWRAFRNVKWPVMWDRTGPGGSHEYDLRLIFDVVAMQWALPVVVNYHEASAFAKWKSTQDGKPYRILTELEHRAIRDEADISTAAGDPVAQLAGHRMGEAGFNLNLAHSSMTPVDLHPVNAKGFHDVFGNAWEWCEDFFCALPGFKVHPFYEDFSTPCFDGQHHVIQGGSFMSTGDEASVHSRFHFRPHFHQHASFRLVESAGELITTDRDAPAPYVGSYPFRRSQEAAAREQAGRLEAAETQRRNALLAKHYLPAPGMQTSAMARLGDVIAEAVAQPGQSRVLEIGCGPGGLALHLAQRFQSVVGVDHSTGNIAFAKDLLQHLREAAVSQRTVEVSVTLRGEGEQMLLTKAALPPPQGLVDFRCADPMCVPAEMKDFDVVVVNDVVDQLASPNALLSRLGGVRGLVRDGGLLAVVSAYQWTPEATPKALWLGGTNQSSQSSEVALVERLRGEFVLLRSLSLPLIWNETRQLLQGKVVQVTLLRRK